MRALKMEVGYTTDGFDETYEVNYLQIEITEEIFEDIKICWDYLENKKDQNIQMVISHDKYQFSTDDKYFDEIVSYLTINVDSNRTINFECNDHTSRTCFSVSVTELKLVEALKSSPVDELVVVVGPTRIN